MCGGVGARVLFVRVCAGRGMEYGTYLVEKRRERCVVRRLHGVAAEARVGVVDARFHAADEDRLVLRREGVKKLLAQVLGAPVLRIRLLDLVHLLPHFRIGVDPERALNGSEARDDLLEHRVDGLRLTSNRRRGTHRERCARRAREQRASADRARGQADALAGRAEKRGKLAGGGEHDGIERFVRL